MTVNETDPTRKTEGPSGAGWIRGVFEGAYVGRVTSGPQRLDEPTHVAGIKLERGTLRTPERAEPPPEAARSAPDTITQRVLPRVLLPPEPGQRAWRQVTLHDLRITDWKLVGPAVKNGRAYGTVVGTVVARLDPPPRDHEPVDGEKTEDKTERRAALASPDSSARTKEKKEASRDEGGALAFGLSAVLVALVSVGLWWGCGPQTALLWFGVAAVSLLLRRTLRYELPKDALGWRLFGIALFAAQLALLWSPVSVWADSGCKPALAGHVLYLAAAPLLAALLPRKLPLLLTGLVFTSVLCTWCSADSGACKGRADAADEVRPGGGDDSARVDAEGRWPRRPGGGRMPQGAFDIGAAREAVPHGRGGGRLNLRLRSSGAGEGALDGEDGPPMSASGEGAVVEPAGADVAGVGEEPPGGEAGAAAVGEGASHSGASVASTPESTAGGGPPSTASPSPGGGVGGGEFLSLDQVDEAPERFFQASPAPRIYVPTDEFFGPDGVLIQERHAGELGVLASLLRQHPGRVAIEVHTDARGSAADMRRLATRRADRVVDWLVKHGVESERLVPIGIGSGKPIVPPLSNRVHQSPNRRLEVRLIGR